MDQLSHIVFRSFYPRLVGLLFHAHLSQDMQTRFKITKEFQDLLEFFVVQLPPRVLNSLDTCMNKTLSPLLTPEAVEVKQSDAVTYFRDVVNVNCESILTTYEAYVSREQKYAKCLKLWTIYHKHFFACLSRALREAGFSLAALEDEE